MSTITTKKFPARIVALAVAAALAVGIGGYAIASTANPEQSQAQQDVTEEILAAQGLTGMDAVEIIEKLDTQPVADRPTDLIASIRPDELVLIDGSGREGSLPMPGDKFYMSFAPYFTQTHPCHFHSLTTCTAEIQDTDIEVLIVDNATGEALVDETMRTFDNGFVGVWLPRNVEVTLTVTLEGKTGSDVFATSQPDDGTCLTTIQLT